MGAWLGHRLIDVGGSQDARRWRQRRGRDATMVTGAVESLVMVRRQQTQTGESGRLRQNPFGIVGVQADALPFLARQSSGLTPNRRRNASPANIVEEPGS